MDEQVKAGRRCLLFLTGGAMTTVFAGCIGDESEDGENGGENGDENESARSNQNSSPSTVNNSTGKANQNTTGGESNVGGENADEQSDETDHHESDLTAVERADEYLSENRAVGYDGVDSIEDETGSDSVAIEVGAGYGLAFDPVAVRVDRETAITWVWTGQGGSHNVSVHEGPETFQNPNDIIGDSGHEYSYTFEVAGAYLYQCHTHTAQGMHGAVLVE